MTYSVGGPAYHRIISEFGEGVRGEGGEINRKALGAIVFADKVRNSGSPYIARTMLFATEVRHFRRSAFLLIIHIFIYDFIFC